MKVAVLGAKGMLGVDLMAACAKGGVAARGYDLPELDITSDQGGLDQIGAVDWVVNCAAYTDVDGAEKDGAKAFAVNRDGVRRVAEWCRKNHAALMQVSTDYVFDGSGARGWLESDLPNPLGVYGRTKFDGEKAIQAVGVNFLIFRTSWVYGSFGQNFVKTMLKLGQERDVLRVVADQHGCPTSAADLAEAILSVGMQSLLVENSDWGTYHYCGQGITTWHEFTEKILEFAKSHTDIKTRKVEAITTAEYPTPAKRPMYSALDCSKIAKYFVGITPKPWQESLKTVIDEIQARQL
jgi:dTDP-4-dehydrorhamnose reductase